LKLIDNLGLDALDLNGCRTGPLVITDAFVSQDITVPDPFDDKKAPTVIKKADSENSLKEQMSKPGQSRCFACWCWLGGTQGGPGLRPPRSYFQKGGSPRSFSLHQAAPSQLRKEPPIAERKGARHLVKHLGEESPGLSQLSPP